MNYSGEHNIRGKKLLILGGADVHCKIVKACQELGVYSIVTDYLIPEKSPAKLIADEHWEVDFNDIEEIVKRSKEAKIDGVLAFCLDPAQIPYLKICERLDLPCYGTKEQFEVLTNKILFKSYCRSHGVDVVPEYTIEDINNNEVRYPVLVKPSMSRGSRGQTVCYSKSDVWAALPNAERESNDRKAIIERYMEGADDMSFAYVIIDGDPFLLKIGDRILGKREDGLDRQQIATILPSLHLYQYKEEVEPAVIKMIKSLDIKFGAVFIQGFWEDGKVYFYDPGMRFPGSDYDIVTKELTGYDNMQTFVKFALTGDFKSKVGNIEKAYELNGYSCVILSIACRAGIIQEIEGIDDFITHPQIVSVSKRYQKADEIPSSGDVRQRVSELVGYFSTREEIKKFIEKVYNSVHIKDVEGRGMIISKVCTSSI